MVKLNKPAKLTNGNKVKCVARGISSESRRGTENPKVVVTTLNEMHRETGIKNLCKIEEELVREYVNVLVNRVDNEEIEPGTATNRISALNRILEYAERNDLRVSAKEYGLSKQQTDPTNKANDRTQAAAYRSWLQDKGQNDPRYMNLYHSRTLQAEFGLRARESYAVKIASKNTTGGKLILGRPDCTKNSRSREVEITKESQGQAVASAKAWGISQGQRSLIPEGYTLKQWMDFANNTLRRFNVETGYGLNNHGERHYYAHERYKELWQKQGHDVKCPAEMGVEREDWLEHMKLETGLGQKDLLALEKQVRLAVSEDLGHSRVSITKTYLG
jgi:hypothetical protein